jgi:hypothetical protein
MPVTTFTKIKQTAAELLSILGFADAAENPAFAFSLRVAAQYVKNKINQENIPCGLVTATAYFAAGEYLRLQKAAGNITKEQMEAAGQVGAAVVSSLKEGDVTVSFATSGVQNAAQQFDALVDTLKAHLGKQYVEFRKLRW